MGNCCSAETVIATHVDRERHGRSHHQWRGAKRVKKSETPSDGESTAALPHTDEPKDAPTLPSPIDTEANEKVTSSGKSGSSESADTSALLGPALVQPRVANLDVVDAPSETFHVQIGNYNLRYAYYSKRGYYPEARKKPNQDAFFCKTNFAGDDQKAFFAVFDGHGQFGDSCSQFAADRLHEALAKELQANVGVLPALTRAHVEVNKEMHDAPHDDSMSGTTSISVLFIGNEIHISNVGDSRAIIAQEDLKADAREDGEKHLIAKPLSIDQTPFRKDERERVKRCGARILTVDQVEGIEPIHENWGLNLGEEIDENGDPPRVWHPYGQYPGTAFTRSLGDLVSEDLGVFAEPEILCKELNVHDRFIIIASDGVFEFLTSQNVVDIVRKFDDPSEACRALVEEAYNRWLQFEVRTDDITAICIYLDGITRSREMGRASVFVGAEMLDLQSMQRPVRGTGRNTIAGTEAIRLSLTEGVLDKNSPMDLPVSKEESKKSDTEVAWIKEIVHGNFLFAHLSESKIMEVISVLQKVEVKAGDVVIRQGAPGDTFFLVDSGEFDVRQLSDESSTLLSLSHGVSESPEQYGDIIHVYKSGPHLHPTFGELALIYSKPRAATVIARQNGVLWALDRLSFRSILMRGRPMRDVVQRLRQISILRPLTVAQTNLVAEEMKPVTFAADETIVHEGNNEKGFFLIISGKVEARSTSDSLPTLELKALDYFGEVSLVRKRSISCRTFYAVDKTECLFITKEVLELAVGRLSAILAMDKLRRTRKKRIARARENATPNSFVLYEREDLRSKLPKTLNEVEVVGTIIWNPTDMVRLVRVKDSEPPIYMTLRSMSKQEVFDASMQTQVRGEHDIHVSLYEKNTLVPHVYGMAVNDTDIHVLYNTHVVGTLDQLLNGEPHGESFVRYYAAQVVMALEFLHSEGIVCRAVDPTNLFVDRNGNLRVLNLRLAKYVGRGRTYTVCGTPEYLSPEQIKGDGHNVAADYWALGVLMYELLCGHTPFSLERNDDIKILNQIATFSPDHIKWPENTSKELRDIIQSLLCPDLTNRLGYRGTHVNISQNPCQAIKAHPFFAGTSWEATMSGSFAAPLEAEAANEFRDLMSEVIEDIDIGYEYTGDTEWLSGF